MKFIEMYILDVRMVNEKYIFEICECERMFNGFGCLRNDL